MMIIIMFLILMIAFFIERMAMTMRCMTIIQYLQLKFYNRKTGVTRVYCHVHKAKQRERHEVEKRRSLNMCNGY